MAESTKAPESTSESPLTSDDGRAGPITTAADNPISFCGDTAMVHFTSFKRRLLNSKFMHFKSVRHFECTEC